MVMSFPAQNARGIYTTIFLYFKIPQQFILQYSTPHLGIQNRKILEDLELKKQILLKTGAVPTPPTVSHPTTPV